MLKYTVFAEDKLNLDKVMGFVFENGFCLSVLGQDTSKTQSSTAETNDKHEYVSCRQSVHL